MTHAQTIPERTNLPGKSALSAREYLPSDDASREIFRANFDRRPFAFRHKLQTADCFTHDALLDLATRLWEKKTRFYVDEGDTAPKNGWSIGSASGRTLMDSLEGIAEGRTLIILKRLQEEPEYREILDVLERELSYLIGYELSSRYRDGLVTLLVSSPGRVTPYHFDGEANLLMQIQGTKSIYIFDAENREVLSSAELEGFWSGDIHAPIYKEHLQSSAWDYPLTPGDGVQNPVIYPHWVQNGPEVSVSLSVNWKRIVDDSADAYRVNRQLRKLGLNPLEPGKREFVDHAKGTIYRTAKRIKRSIRSHS